MRTVAFLGATVVAGSFEGAGGRGVWGVASGGWTCVCGVCGFLGGSDGSRWHAVKSIAQAMMESMDLRMAGSVMIFGLLWKVF